MTVKVGSNGTCNQVKVMDVPVGWQESYLLKVTYDLGPASKICHILRFQFVRCSSASFNGAAWLANASVRFQPRENYSPLETDTAGRALLIMKSGTKASGTVSANGYAAKSFSVFLFAVRAVPRRTD